MDDDNLCESNPMITDTRIKVINPLRKILVGTRQGLFRITGDVNTETQWCWRRDRYLRDHPREISGMASEPGTGALLASFRAGNPRMMLSEDGGKHWLELESWPADFSVCALATPGGGRVVIGSEGGRLYRGELPEGGWEQSKIPGPPGEIRSLSWDLADPKRWLAALGGGGVAFSLDGGVHWERPLAGIPTGKVVHSRGGVGIAISREGAMRSQDSGATWMPIELPGAPLGLCVDVAGTLFMALEVDQGPALYSSVNTGVDWSPVAESATVEVTGAEPVALEADTFHPGAVYLGRGSEVYLVAPSGARKVAENLPGILDMLVI